MFCCLLYAVCLCCCVFVIDVLLYVLYVFIIAIVCYLCVLLRSCVCVFLYMFDGVGAAVLCACFV